MKSSAVLGGMMVGMTLLGVAASGCGRSVEYYNMMCECELCNDRKYDECIISTDAELERAAAYECDAEAEEYLDCVIAKADCDDNRMELDSDDCDNESEDYYECIEDATDLGGSSSSSSGQDVCFCACECETGSTVTQCNGNGCCNTACDTQCQIDNLGFMTSNSESCGGGGEG